MIVVDDHVLAAHLGGTRAVGPEGGELATTCAWWWRLAISAGRLHGRPIDEVPGSILVPERIDLLPVMARLGVAYRLSVMAAEALAAAEVLGADIVVGRDTPRLREAARVRGITYLVEA